MGFAAVASLFLAGACADGEELIGQTVVSQIPWAAPETARYRLMKGDEVVGSGILSIEDVGGELRLSQRFRGGEFTDEALAVVDGSTLRPKRVERTITGPEGSRRCEATYGGGRVEVLQRSERGERRDELDVPWPSYDSWSDLFLWRTLSFVNGAEVAYVDVLTCTLAKPGLTSVRLTVKGKEGVEVPAGGFQAWLVEIRSQGRTQRAWFADEEERALVRYDNGSLVFELESME